MESPAIIQVGAARVRILNAGDMVVRLADELAVPEEIWRQGYADAFERQGLCPSLSVLIQHADANVLVDVNDYRATIMSHESYLPPHYSPPPDIPAQLATCGVQETDVSHVVITHAHWDHFAGVTRPGPVNGGYEATFLNARCYLGTADWNDAETQESLRDPESLVARTLGTLHAVGQLELVDGARGVADGVEIRPAPGETAGHQMVRVHSAGETLYVLGDLFHDPIEVEHPEWMVTWADAETMLATRRALIADALAENALLVAAHIPGVGRLERTEAGVRWVAG